MSSRSQAPRRKKTKEEIKKARAKRENVTRNEQANEMLEMRKDRQELQASLGGVVRSIHEISKTINDPEYLEKLGAERIEECHTAIKDFVKELDDKKDFVKETVAHLNELEESVIQKNASIEDTIFPYNLTATPLMDTIIGLTHKGIEAIATCSNVMSQAVSDVETTTEEPKGE